jgi:glycine betaine/choline ABC-type transport system substrate-binding protein
MHYLKGIVFAVLMTAVLAASALACTGKTVTIARTADLQQEILAQMLVILIDARTGTTVDEKVYPTAEEAHAAVVGHDADIGIEYTGIIRTQTLGKEKIEDADKLYVAVKEEYDKNLNLLTLPPLGFSNQTLDPKGDAGQAVIILRRDTWTKFPALDKLIAKLSGKIDAIAMQKLEERAANEDLRTIVREFLRANRLLF